MKVLNIKRVVSVLALAAFAATVAGCADGQRNQNDETSFVRLVVVSATAVSSSARSQTADSSTVTFRAFPFRTGGNPAEVTEFVRLIRYSVEFDKVYPSYSGGLSLFVMADGKDVAADVTVISYDAKSLASGKRPVSATATVTFEGRDSYNSPISVTAHIPVAITN